MKIRSIPVIRVLFASCSIAAASSCYSQTPTPIVINIYPETDIHSISSYIYGSNGQSNDRDENITARRIGGNRLTGYNWENNASNAGTDYINHSDDYLTYISGITGADAKKPGIVISTFHDTSLAMRCYSVVTLQAAGYVAADFNGTVAGNETAPSSRWKEVKFAKGSPFGLSPDLNDNVVYMDEEVNFLVNKYSSNKIRGYEIDNEPGLWPSTHPRIHPNKPSVAEYTSRSSALAKAVKAVDPTAEIFGGVMYGFAEYRNFQDAPDWNSYNSYGTYINAYLSIMKDSSDIAGKRLLDVLDLHWYPEAQGQEKNGNLVRIAQLINSDSGVAAAREQAPRTLWDSSYKENSWIAQYFSPVALLPWLRSSITKYYPGTKLAFTEINYGGDSSISGAIAMADVLGLFGKYDVYFSSYWGPLVSYIASAYKIFRNYDGSKSIFGDMYCKATTSDTAASSVYTSLDSRDSTILHIIVINKNFTGHPVFNIAVHSQKEFGYGAIFILNSGSENIFHPKVLYQMTNNAFSFSPDPQSIAHFVFSMKPSAVVSEDRSAPKEIWCTNDLSGGTSVIHYDVVRSSSVTIIDMHGNVIRYYPALQGTGTIEFSGASGVYEVILTDGSGIEHEKILIIH